MSLNKSGDISKTKSAKFLNLSVPNLARPPLLVSPRLSKEKMNKSEFHRKNKEKNALK